MLECAGHKVTCLDLRSAGIDPSDANTIYKFEEYNEPFDNLLSGLGEGEKVILVGHSAGGLSLTAALHKYPEKIQVAFYLAAIMYRNDFEGEAHSFSSTNVEEMYEYGYGEGPHEPPTSLMIKKQFQRHLLYQRSPLEDSTLAGMLLKPMPIRALHGVKFPDGGKEIDKVPRVYIKTLYDNTIPQEGQDGMIKKWPPSDVFSIQSDHCAFFSQPFELFALLQKVATSCGYEHNLPN